jgi:hypothetical protein
MTDELRRRLQESVGTNAEAPVDDIVARGRRRRRRQHRGWVGASGLLALVIIAAVVVLSKPGTTQLRGVGPAIPGTSPTSTGVSPAASACQAGSLLATASWEGAQPGSVAGGIAFTNTGKAACYLQGQPKVQLFDQHGQLLAVAETPVSASNVTSSAVPVVLAPGSGADELLVQWFNFCASNATPVQVRVVFASGPGSVSVTPPINQAPDCLVSPPSLSTIDVGNVEALTGSPFPTQTPSPAPSAALVTATIPGGGTLLVPSGWQYVDESYPSDHSTYLWYNPQDEQQRVEFYGSGCVGCVSNVTGTDAYTIPMPSGGLPTGVVSTTPVSGCQLGFLSTTFTGDYTAQPFPPSSLPDTGQVLVSRFPSGRVTGYARIDVWLPTSNHVEAQAIAGGVKEALSGGAGVC